MRKLLILLPLLAGCAQTQEFLAEAPAADPAALCQSYASAVNTITTLIEVGVVDAQGPVADATAGVIEVVAPICEAPEAPATNSVAFQRLLDGAGNLLAVQTQVIETSLGE